ncbi:MAG: acyl-CoA dehydrogenase family protein [Clostridiales bacterium]|nr:acyl-CoA dehydrogenase family protein [Clostridiales bacterium]
MLFDLTPEQLLVQKLARDFAQNEVAPIAAEIDRDSRFPQETVDKLFRYGFFGICCPKAYGGAGGDTMSYVLMLEELAKCCASTAVITSVHGGLCMYLLNRFGSGEQKAQWLPRMNRDTLCSFALTEPDAGTDAATVSTMALQDGEDYVLNGSKTFITNAGHAGLYIILASTDRTKGTKGITAFLVSADNPGLTVGPPEEKMGLHASATCEVVLQDCRVPVCDRLGREGEGMKIALSGLDCGRIGIATQSVGIAQGAIDQTKEYVSQRVQFGRRISQFQNTQFVLASLQTKTDAARLLAWRAAALRDGGKPFGQEAAMAKLFASETANEVTRACLQLFGGYGYTRAYPIERMMRDAKVTEIYEGTSEAQKIVISRAMGVR